MPLTTLITRIVAAKALEHLSCIALKGGCRGVALQVASWKVSQYVLCIFARRHPGQAGVLPWTKRQDALPGRWETTLLDSLLSMIPAPTQGSCFFTGRGTFVDGLPRRASGANWTRGNFNESQRFEIAGRALTKSHSKSPPWK